MIPFDLNKNKSLTLKQIRILKLEVQNLLIENFEKIINQKYTMYKPSKLPLLKGQENFQIIY